MRSNILPARGGGRSVSVHVWCCQRKSGDGATTGYEPCAPHAHIRLTSPTGILARMHPRQDVRAIGGVRGRGTQKKNEEEEEECAACAQQHPPWEGWGTFRECPNSEGWWQLTRKKNI